ncbi:transmembrane signal receptor [Lithospermum erythrorhizon]|uniref:Transmembrane signal receptor n=1 Tax=Lithospermum erythrorhizon TaxID=34254 RepID=A0AAV3PE97_LITER
MNSQHDQTIDQVINPPCQNELGNDLDIPIALRKGTRNCVKYPISMFVSYSNLASTFKAFITSLSSVIVPRNIEEALKILEWKVAVYEEMKALEKNETWNLVTLPREKRVVGCKWVFTIKYNEKGIIERYKARLVAKGFTQTYGIDFSETFAPVAKLNTIRVLLSFAANLDWELHQLDVKNAFLNGELEEEVYMKQPPGFEDASKYVCKLKKSLYRLKQSPRAWFNRFSKSVKDLGYMQCQADHILSIHHNAKGKITILIIYVDDIIITYENIEEIHRIEELLAREYEIKDLGKLKYFLGMEIARSQKGISVSQRKYRLDLLEETGAFDDRKSTSGYCTLIWGNLVTWRSKKQNVVARSSAKAKYRAMSHDICETIWIKLSCEEVKIQYEAPIQLFCDNQSAISITHNPV